MNKVFDKLKNLLTFKKSEPWYKRALKKTALIVDMKRRNKIITFFVLLLVAVYFCMPSMESIIKKVVHQYGSQIIGTDVSIGGVDLALSDGMAMVKNIKIGNPKGYQSPYLFYLKELDVQIDISSLASDTIIIEKINITAPEINYETDGLKKSNVSDILNNIQKNTASDSQTEPEKENTAAGSSKKVIIKSLVVTDGKVAAILGKGALKAPITVSLPTIKMSNIGQEKQGSSPVETITAVITKILQTASQAVLSANLEGLQDAAQNVAGNLKEGAQNLQQQGKDALDNLKNLGGLFSK